MLIMIIILVLILLVWWESCKSREGLSRSPASVVRNPPAYNPAGLQRSRARKYIEMRQDEEIDECLNEYNKCMAEIS